LLLGLHPPAGVAVAEVLRGDLGELCLVGLQGPLAQDLDGIRHGHLVAGLRARGAAEQETRTDRSEGYCACRHRLTPRHVHGLLSSSSRMLKTPTLDGRVD